MTKNLSAASVGLALVTLILGFSFGKEVGARTLEPVLGPLNRLKVFRLRASQVEIIDWETGMRRAVLGSTNDGSVVLSFMANPVGLMPLLKIGLTNSDSPFITIFDKEGKVIAELSVEYGEKTSLTIQIDGQAELLETAKRPNG